MLTFSWREISKRSRGLTFDDVLIVPSKSEIRSRRDPSLSSKLTKNISIETPLIAANMDTITESEMMVSMHALGSFAILHRFMSIEDQVKNVHAAIAKGVKLLGASVGAMNGTTSDEVQTRASKLIEAGVNVITVDIAHGHSVMMMDTVEWLKKTYTGVDVIAGNIATPQGVLDLINCGADAVKVGIGPGSMCTTRIITGCGVPQLTAIAMCAEAAEKHGVPIIADGGMRTSGDIVKAFAAGASTVMLGSMLSGTLETPGEIKQGRKIYRGMASKSAQVSWRGTLPQGMAAEGEATYVNIKGHVSDVIHEITGGIRSGMSYVNAQTLSEISKHALFMEMSPAGTQESRAHGVTFSVASGPLTSGSV